MADFASRESLYRDTLDSASTEMRELTQEIANLRGLLEDLERRKRVVEQICIALGDWVSLTERDDSEPLPEASISTVAPQGVKLTEEEVSLIAYPRLSQQSA